MPREDRLTVVTAAVLERVDGLAHDVIDAVLASAATAANDRLFDADDEAEATGWQVTFDGLEAMLGRLRALSRPRLRIDTQRTTASRKFVDLEIQLSPQPSASGDRFLFWVEIKHGAGVHGTQLTDYETDIALRDADHRLVLVLAPRQSVPDITDVPQTMPVVHWQAVAEVVRRWTKRPGLSEVEHFLLIDYLAFLREEGLMDEELLTAEHAFVLRAEPAAGGAVAKLMELTDDHITEHWGPRGKKKGGQKPDYSLGYWAHYSLTRNGGLDASELWRSSTLEWGLFKDTSRDDPRNAWVFASGATFWLAKDNPAALSDNAAWLARRRVDGFEYVNEWSWRLFRFRYPEEVLAATTLDTQVALLGDWVIESFQLLADNPPEH